jgi:hypothetical protein
MLEYTAPIKEMKFTLKEVIKIKTSQFILEQIVPTVLGLKSFIMAGDEVLFAINLDDRNL